MYLVASILVFVGTLLLCFSMQKHFKVLWTPKSNSANVRSAMRIAGYFLLLLALYVASQIDDLGIALTTIFGIFTVMHLTVAICLGQKEAKLHSRS